MKNKCLIYGIGAMGKIAFFDFTSKGIYDVIGFVDNDETGKELFGIPIFSSKEAIDIANINNCYIFICGKYHKNQMIKSLELFCFKKYRIFEYISNESFYKKLNNKFIIMYINVVERFSFLWISLLFPFSGILYLMKFRVLKNFQFLAFGHLVHEPHFLIAKEQKKYKYIMIVDESKVVNNFVLNLWKESEYFIVIKNKYLFHILWYMTKFNFFAIDVSIHSGKNIPLKDKYYHDLDDITDKNKIKYTFLHSLPYQVKKIQEFYKDKSDDYKIINISESLINKCYLLIKQYLNIDKYDNFIIWHVRNDRKYDLARSIDNVINYKEGIEYLQQKGFKIIVFTENKDISYFSDFKNLIYYNTSPIKSETIDIFLISECSLYIAASSGPTAYAEIFRKKIIQINSPTWMVSPIEYKNQRSFVIFKPFFNKNLFRFVTIEEYFNEDLWFEPLSVNYKSEEYDILDNSSDEIYHIIEEAYLYFFENKQDLIDDVLQNRVKIKFLGSLPQITNTIISPFFIKKYNWDK